MLGALLLGPGVASAGGDLCYDWEIVNVDGDKPTSWWGINDRGLATGNHCTTVDCDPFDVIGAVLDVEEKTTTSVFNVLTDDPGFVAEFDVNNFGSAAGYAFDFATSEGVAYIRRASGRIIIVPDYRDDVVQQLGSGINDWGFLVGSSFLEDESSVSWAWHPWFGFIPLEIEVGGVGNFLVSDINNFGTVIGTLSEDGVFPSAAVIKSLFGRARTFVGEGLTVVNGLNDWGQVVGTVFDEEFFGQAVVWDRFRGFRNLDMPTALGDTAAEGINNRGEIVGTVDLAFDGVIGTPCED